MPGIATTPPGTTREASPQNGDMFQLFVRRYSQTDATERALMVKAANDGAIGYLSTVFVLLSDVLTSSREKTASDTGFDADTLPPLIDINRLRGLVYDPNTRGLGESDRVATSAVLSAAESMPSRFSVPGYATPEQFSNLAIGLGTNNSVGQLIGLGFGALAQMAPAKRQVWQRAGLFGGIAKTLTNELF